MAFNNPYWVEEFGGIGIYCTCADRGECEYLIWQRSMMALHTYLGM